MLGLSLVVGLPLAVGTSAALGLGRRAHRAAAMAAGVVTVLTLAVLVALAAEVWQGVEVRASLPWFDAAGLAWQLRLDALGVFFAALILGMGVLVITYAAYYLGPDDPPGKFFATLMLFMAAMLGIVLADNLLLLVVFWELTSISSFLLVGYWSHRSDARAGALQALVITGSGGLALLAGAVLLGQIADTYTISELVAQGRALQAHPWFVPAMWLILLGAFTKSAQFPFHFWLPDAMAAPTPVSAYLHSATMVKAGLFLLLRLLPVFEGSSLFTLLVVSAGLATLTVGAFIAIFKHDLKGLLAYSTVSHLGLTMTLIGLATPMATAAAVLHIFNHAAFKAALFMSAGIVDHETGSRDLRHVNGMIRFMPVTAVLAIIAAAGMAGLPFFNGFISKELFFTQTLTAGHPVVPLLATIAAIGSVAYSFRFIHDTFFNGDPSPHLPNPHPHEPPWGMRVPVMLLAAAVIVFGVLPAAVEPLIVRVAEAAIAAPVPQLHLVIWHHPGLHVLMSAIALTGGGLLYALLIMNRRLHAVDIDTWFGPHAGRKVFTRTLRRVVRWAGGMSERLDNGDLRRVLRLTALAALAVVVGLGWEAGVSVMGRVTTVSGSEEADLLALLFWLTAAISCWVLWRHHHRHVLAVIVAGVLGLLSAATFAAFSAPDLAMTQISVEVVTTVLLFIALMHLPTTSAPSPRAARGMDAAIALMFGAAVTVLALALLENEAPNISWYFLREALPGGGGSNVVNVILVDFRGYDTMGEITVLGIAGLGVWAVLAGWSARRPTPAGDHQPWVERQPLLLRALVSVLLPLALLLAVYVFLRGHNLPGGGFIAGLMTAAAILLVFLAHGHERALLLLGAQGGWRFAHGIALGLAIALATGVAAMLLGAPFLTSAHAELTIPGLGTVPLASAALFDLGVYVTVVCATVLMLTTLAAGERTGAEGVAPVSTEGSERLTQHPVPEGSSAPGGEDGATQGIARRHLFALPPVPSPTSQERNAR